MPFAAQRRHQYWSVDIRYIEGHGLAADKPVYVSSSLENVSRAILSYDRLSGCLLREALPLLGAGPLLVAVDGLQVPRSSRTMPGTSWLKHPRTPPFKLGIYRAQRFVELALQTNALRGASRT